MFGITKRSTGVIGGRWTYQKVHRPTVELLDSPPAAGGLTKQSTGRPYTLTVLLKGPPAAGGKTERLNVHLIKETNVIKFEYILKIYSRNVD